MNPVKRKILDLETRNPLNLSNRDDETNESKKSDLDLEIDGEKIISIPKP